MVMNNRCATWSTKETTPTQHTAKESDTHAHTTQVKYKQTPKVMENHNVKEDMNQQVCYHCSFQKAFISDDANKLPACTISAEKYVRFYSIYLYSAKITTTVASRCFIL